MVSDDYFATCPSCRDTECCGAGPDIHSAKYLALISKAKAEGAAEERATIVKWLRSEIGDADACRAAGFASVTATIRHTADLIEECAHREPVK